MSTAHYRSGCPIEAAAGAPEHATCPHCGGVVILRRRSSHRHSSDVSHFWRHRDRDNSGCPARFVVGARINKCAGPALAQP